MSDPIVLQREAAEQIWGYIESLNLRIRNLEAMLKMHMEQAAAVERDKDHQQELF